MKCLKEKSPPEGFFSLLLLGHFSCFHTMKNDLILRLRDLTFHDWQLPLTPALRLRRISGCRALVRGERSPLPDAAIDVASNYPSTGVRGRWSDFSTFELNMVQGTWVIHSYFMTNPEPFTEPFTTYEYTWRFLVWTLLNFKGAVCTVFVLFFLLSFLFSAALN